MNVAALAEFFRSLDHRVIQTRSCFWYSPQALIFKSLPFHEVVSPSPAELAKVFVHGPALALRYPTPPGGAQPDGGMYICSTRDYDLSSLSANVRSHTRRGLARCSIKRTDFDDLADRGFALIEDTTLRQTGGRPAQTLAQWKMFCTVAATNQDTEAWGAFVGDELAAFIVGMHIDDCYYIHVQKSASSLLKYYPNNAITFAVLKEKLSTGAASYVSHGQIALAAREGLFHFKRSMGFEIQPFKERVIFNPVIKTTLRLGRGLAGAFQRRYPENLFWRRVSRSLDLARHSY